MKPTSSHLLTLLVGVACGTLAATLFQGSGSSTPPARKAASSRDSGNTAPALSATRLAQVEKAQEENARLRELLAEKDRLLDQAKETIRKLEECGPTATTGPEKAPQTDHPPTAKEVQAAIDGFAGKLQALWLGKGGEEELTRLRAVLKRGGEQLRAKLVTEFQSPKTELQRVVVLAHVLAQSGDPVAITALENTLRDPDAGDIRQRFAAHALAFSPAEGLEPLLTQVAHDAKDLGARANAAWGLVRRKVPESVALYGSITDRAFEQGDPAAIMYLQGFMLMGEQGHAAVKERLRTYQGLQAKVALITIARRTNNKSAIPELEQLAYDAGQPKSVQDAARGALEALKRNPRNPPSNPPPSDSGR